MKLRNVLITALLLLISTSFLTANEMHDAVQEGNLARIDSILTLNPDLLESKNDAGLTPLNLAAYIGQMEIITFLLDKGADIFTGDNEGSMPIHNAAANGQKEVVEFLVNEKGIDVNVIDDNDVTPLHFAAGSGNIEMVRFLISKGVDINARSNIGGIPLHNAIFRDSIDVIKLLIDSGSDVNIANQWNVQAIHLATHRGNPEVVKLLIEKGADIHAITGNDENPLIWAIVGRRFEIADFLLENGADINGKVSRGRTPLHSAFKASLESIEYMIKKGADVNAADSTGAIPLHTAAWSGNAEVVKYLIDHGAKVNTIDEDGRTPLINSIYLDSIEVVKVLLENGAEIDPKVCPSDVSCNYMDGTAIHIATKKGKFDYVKLFVKNKEDVDIKDDRYGRTPLHYAAITGYNDIAEFLIKNGADINFKDNDKRTPLYFAKKHENKKIADYLDSINAKSGEPGKIYRKDLLSEDIKEGEAYLWYLFHSSYAIKTKNHLLIFDFWEHERKPDQPCLANGWINPEELKDQNVTVFVTHEHRDHYDSVIFEWKEVIPDIQYIFGFQPREVPDYEYIAPRETKTFNGIQVTTIESNDSGVGFLINVDGLTIFDPGDHANRQRDFSGNYLDEIYFLKEMNPDIDFSFMPISGCGFRDLEAVKLGVYRTFEELKPRVFFPVHAGGSEYRYKDFVEEAKENGYTLQMCYPLERGERYFYKNKKIQ